MMKIWEPKRRPLQLRLSAQHTIQKYIHLIQYCIFTRPGAKYSHIMAALLKFQPYIQVCFKPATTSFGNLHTFAMQCMHCSPLDLNAMKRNHKHSVATLDCTLRPSRKGKEVGADRVKGAFINYNGQFSNLHRLGNAIHMPCEVGLLVLQSILLRNTRYVR